MYLICYLICMHFAANNGCVCAGGIPAGIYITSTPDACHYISEHSKANLVIVDSNEQLQKYTSISGKLPHLKAIVVWGCDVDPMIAKKCSVPVYHWDHFMTLVAHITPRKLNARMEALRPGNCVSLIYTSGTTGPPKAVMLSHDNVTWSCKIFANQYVTNGMVPGKVVSYLPLSHVAAQMIDINYTFYSGSCCYFAQTDALKGSLSTTLKEVLMIPIDKAFLLFYCIIYIRRLNPLVFSCYLVE
jgi:long-chain-fatty-acid--CoA ligase ACSBG